MDNCEGCYWFGNCPSQGERCEHYYPVGEEESVVAAEYEEALRERYMDYEELVAEQQQ